MGNLESVKTVLKQFLHKKSLPKMDDFILQYRRVI